MIRIALRAAMVAALLVGTAWAQEAAVTRRATDLREKPGDAGRSIAALPAQSPVTRTSERQGPWVQVRTANGATGWVHLFDLGPATTTAASDSGSNVVGGALRGVSNLFGGGNSKPATTSTTAGIRGLGAEDLAQAQPDPAAVQQLEGQRAADADVRSFAQRAAWKPVDVPALPAPSRVATPNRPDLQGQPQ